MVTLCELLPVPPPRAKFTFCQLLPAPHFNKVGILSTFGDTLRTCGAPFVTFCHHFCRISVLLQTLTLHPRVYESGGGNAKNSPFPLPNIKKAGQMPRRVRADKRAFLISMRADERDFFVSYARR